MKLLINSEKKASTSLFVVILISTLILIILLLMGVMVRFQNTSLQQRADTLNQRMSTSSEMVKNYEDSSIINGLMNGTYASAATGAGAGNSYWIAWNVLLKNPTIDQAKNSITNYALPAVNTYILAINGTVVSYSVPDQQFVLTNELFPQLVVNPGTIKNLTLFINQTSLEQNAHGIAPADDNIPFYASGNQTYLYDPLLMNQTAYFSNNYLDTLYPTRFWYIYRKLKDNLETFSCNNIPVFYGCGEASKCGVFIASKGSLSYSYLDQLVRNLNTEMKNVTCSYQLLCDNTKTTVNTKTQSDCQPYECDGKTITPDTTPEACKNHMCSEDFSTSNCTTGSPKEACYKLQPSIHPSKEFPFTNKHPQTNSQFSGSGCVIFWENITVNFVANISCVDNQYQWPLTKQGYKNLEFNFLVHIGMTHASGEPPDDACCPKCHPSPSPISPPPPPSPTSTQGPTPTPTLPAPVPGG